MDSKKSEGMKIRILPEGPYEVIGGVPLNQAIIVPDTDGAGAEWKDGKSYQPADEPYHLCRCGHSGNKPYCDGQHKMIKFVGLEVADKTPYEEAAELYEGKTMDLLDQRSLCAVARFCDRFDGVWELAVNGVTKDERDIAVYEACCCPSGRLTIVKKNGEKIEPPLECEISVVQDPATGHKGPLWVKGGIKIEGSDGEEYETRNRVTLCRCGQSSNMPFCDSSHLNCTHMEGMDK